MAKVLFVNTHGEIAGAEKSLLLLMSHIAKCHEVNVACPSSGPLHSAVRTSGYAAKVLDLPQAQSLRSIAGAGYWMYASARVIAAASLARADIIHANNLHAAAVCLPAAAIGRAGFIWHARDVCNAAWLVRLLGRFSRRIIAVSDWVRRQIISQGVDPAKIIVVHNGVKIDGARDAHPARDTVSSAPFTFANVGQFVPWKKQALFLDAAQLVAHEMPNARFWLVGDDVFRRDPAYVTSLREHVAAGGLAENVVFTGWRRDMETVFEGIDCLVHAADAEPFGRVIIEAMAAGVPVIAVNSGGPAEIIVDGETGVLASPDNPEAMAAAMLKVARDRAFAQRLASSAREDVVRRFDARLTAEKVEEIYRQVLGERSPHGARRQ